MAVLVNNKKARFDYEITDSFEAGIELLGSEVKSLKKGQGDLAGSYVIVRGGEVFLVNAHIPPYQPANIKEGYDPARPRKLLLTKKEIDKLLGAEKQKGLTIIPIMVYTKGKKLKVEVGIARGKKKHDKRETIKKKDTERDIARTLKNKLG